MTAGAVLLPAAIAWPALLCLLFLARPLRRLAAALLPTLALPALILAFTADSALELRAPGLFTSMRLGVDSTGRPFLLLTALLWCIAGWHAVSYMRDDPRRLSFSGFMLATGLGNVGLVLAQDALSFYLFFAFMTFAAYGLVVHTRTADALRAGRIYIIMAVIGEALILAGLFAVTALATDASFQSIPDAYAALSRPGVIAALFFFGFGVKAGLMPVHLWLPLAHPVAPTPASALLSGAMIKAGVLGWLRYLPIGTETLPTLGATAMVIGTLATVVAVAIGVTQRDVKTVLAYSSISQMGFITVGIGAALVLPAAAPLLILAVAVYAIHHATAKAALFLGASVVTGMTPMWRLLTAAVPGLVLAGAPLTSGALAKSALKHALGDVPPPGFVPVDLLLTIAAVGTTLIMARYVALLALPGTATVRSAARPHTDERSDFGIVAPWLLLTGIAAAAAVWLPMSMTPLGELPLATTPGYIAAAAWPVVLGALLAASALLLKRRYPALTITTVPAGDIVAVLERVGRQLHRAVQAAAAIDISGRRRKWTRRTGARAGSVLDDVARGMDRVAASPALGLLFAIVALLLFATMR